MYLKKIILLGENFKANAFIIQKYIEKPFLINNRKFDIRVWALVDTNLNSFFFKYTFFYKKLKSFYFYFIFFFKEKDI